MNAETGLNVLYDRDSSRPNIQEAKVIPGMANEELTNIEDVHKTARNDQQPIRIKTKKSMTTDQRRGQRGSDKHQRLEPGKTL